MGRDCDFFATCKFRRGCNALGKVKRSMHFDTHFKGRVIQVTEALSFDDAVSNQVLALDQMLQGMGLRTAVHTKRHDERLEQRRQPIEALQVTEQDILIYHLYGTAEHTLLHFPHVTET